MSHHIEYGLKEMWGGPTSWDSKVQERLNQYRRQISGAVADKKEEADARQEEG